MNKLDTNCKGKFMSFNVRGLNGDRKRLSIFRYIKKQLVDICLLQETFSTIQVENKWRNEWGGSVIFNHGSNHSRGTMILIRSGFDFVINNTVCDNEGRIIIVKAKWCDINVVVINLYAPTADSCRFRYFENLVNIFHDNLNNSDINIIAGGILILSWIIIKIDKDWQKMYHIGIVEPETFLMR